ncbi:AmmeMemoRadiSam system protein B [Thiohalophilus sp.]|uniref:AmmeMemoRadiSam system protein B n=1 Tax=Thiohalophilus sp. TaxID=3028392 RepID=UPI002ACE5C8D|nr:AmmeMemoRadiSam system protein B [Thiohalophilus sp.]MDZ7663282.1 AmmeMemoRadiSam system protein B [Thiohalophilus sp.]
MSQHIRQPAVAGMFYPAEPARLRSMLEEYLQQARTKLDTEQPVPRAIIAPHAGYVYSGPVAASAYARIQPAHARFKRVLLLGPSHRVAVRGLATSSASHFLTPFGQIPLDRAAIERLETLPQVTCADQAHAMEHSLEVQLPFLQIVLDEFVLVPLVVGDADPHEVDEVIEQFWDDQTLIVISSDLSHYHDYATAQRLDSATSKAIESLQPDAIGYGDACGRNPVNGLLQFAREHGLHATMVDLRNSGDTAGPRDQVVGYGAYLIQ